MPRARIAPRPRDRIEVPEEPRELPRREDARPRRGELDRERHAVEPADDLVHGVALGRGDGRATRGLGSLEEQALRVSRRFGRERQELERPLRLDPEELARGREEASLPREGEPARERLGRGLDDLLEVVEHDERAPSRREGGAEERHGIAARERDSDRGGDSGREVLERARLREVAEPDASRLVARPGERMLRRETGLARAARAPERHEPRSSGEGGLDGREVARASYEARRPRHDVRAHGALIGRWRERRGAGVACRERFERALELDRGPEAPLGVLLEAPLDEGAETCRDAVERLGPLRRDLSHERNEAPGGVRGTPRGELLEGRSERPDVGRGRSSLRRSRARARGRRACRRGTPPA